MIVNICSYNIKNKRYHTVGTIPKSNISKIVKGARSIHLSHKLNTTTSIKSGGVKLDSEIMRSCKCFPRVIKMATLT